MTTSTSHAATAAGTAHTVVSRDGARIAYLTLGSGPSVIVIPGALASAADYAAFARALAARFTVHTIERRGRGLSSPQGDDYSIVKECEDVLALQRATGAPFLAGHSFGGLVALEAARNNASLAKVAVYEPGVSIDGSVRMDWMPGYERKLDEHKPLDALVEFILGVGPERARHTPRWLMKRLLPLFMSAHDRQQALALLRENLREHREVARLDGSYPNYREVSAGVLLLCGGKSDATWVGPLRAVLPRSEASIFPKLDHFGLDKKAPRRVATAVSEYFLA
jgi:pimeloyl-ACP methyl ester carboxylesterase